MLTFYASYDIISIKGAILLLFEFTGHVFANILHEYDDRLNVTEIGHCRGTNEDSTLCLLRENHFLHIVVDGTLEFNGMRMGRGGVMYLKPMISHDVVIPEGETGEHYWLSFGGSGSDALLSDTGLLNYPVSRVDEKMIDVFIPIFHEAVYGAGMSEKQLAAKFEGILRYVLPFINDRSLPDTDTKRGTARAAEYTERAVEYIRHSFHTGIRPTDVAEYLGVTEKYLCKLFRVRYGMTPEMFLSKCRSDKAQRLLRTTSLDIRTISSLCGFDDPTYFARWFRKKSGVSATGYREKLDENSKSAAEKGAADER